MPDPEILPPDHPGPREEPAVYWDRLVVLILVIATLAAFTTGLDRLIRPTVRDFFAWLIG